MTSPDVSFVAVCWRCGAQAKIMHESDATRCDRAWSEASIFATLALRDHDAQCHANKDAAA